jgi:hypothetical protein
VGNFTLWNAWIDAHRTTITLFATSEGLQRINKGTPEMVKEMLDDIGAPKADVSGWKVDAFATDYLSDDLDSEDWEDRWQASWEVQVQLKRAIDFKPKPMDLVESLASDSTWKGEEPAPPKAMVVADFGDRQTTQNAQQLLTSEKARPAVQGLEVIESPAHENQLLVTLPAGKSFFESHATAAVKIEEICQQQGGTTHWRERVHRR